MAVVERDNILDWMKGVLIVCVVWGHTMRVGSCADMLDEIVLRGIYGFHMPLFMLLAGYFYKVGEPSEMITKTLRRITVPYVVASILFGIIYLLQGRSFVEVVSGVMLGRANGALWFLYALALIQLVITVGIWIGRMWLGKGIVVAVCLVMFALAICSPIRCEPWMLFYFGCGMVLARNKALFPSGIVGIIGFIAIIWYGHPWYTELCWQTIGLSLFALMTLHGVALKVSKVKWINVFTWLGRHTMAILIFHPLFNAAYKVLSKPLLAMDGSGVFFFLSSACFAVCGCVVLELALRKCRVGWLLGFR